MPRRELIVNYAKCTECRLCESAYSIGHAGETNPAKSRIRIARSHEEADVYCIPVKCIACENPPCMVVCPANAISTHPENGSRVEDKTDASDAIRVRLYVRLVRLSSPGVSERLSYATNVKAIPCMHDSAPGKPLNMWHATKFA